MPIDATKVGQVTAQLMEVLDDSDGTELGEVLVLVEVRGTDKDGDDWTSVQWRCSDPRYWVQRGLLHYALRDQETT